MKNLLADEAMLEMQPHITLLEFDERFGIFPEYVRYDFQQPLKLDPDMKGKYDRILCDPPFLSSDCQIKTAITIRWLTKQIASGSEASKARVIICTGERMEDVILRLHVGVKTTTFQPRHAQDRLSNEFRCYANYESDLWPAR